VTLEPVRDDRGYKLDSYYRVRADGKVVGYVVKDDCIAATWYARKPREASALVRRTRKAAIDALLGKE
jgi:hypothetical protein